MVLEDVMALPRNAAPQSILRTYDIDEDGFTVEKWDASGIDASGHWEKEQGISRRTSPLICPLNPPRKDVPILTFRSLAGRSKGKAYLVSDGETVLLLECGLP